MRSDKTLQFFLYPLPMARGICILSVILIHTTTASMTIRGSDFLTSILIFLNCSARFAVPLFITLSGFYLSLSPKNENTYPFYRRTLKYLILPYIIWSLIYSFPDFHRNGNVLQVIWNLLTASASAHLWFGLLILQLYLLHPVLSRWYRTHKHHGIILFSALFLQIAWNISLSILFRDPDPLRSGAPLVERFGALCFVSNIGYFLGGYFLLEHADEAVRLLQKATFICAIAVGWLSAAIGLSIYWGIPTFRGITNVLTLRSYIAQSVLLPFLSFFALGIIFLFVKNRLPSKNVAFRILHSLGLYSYGIYYIHGLALWFISWAIRHIFMSNIDSGYYFLLVFPLTTLISLYSIKILTRLPFSKYIA